MKVVSILLSERARKEIGEAAAWWALQGRDRLIDDAVTAVLVKLEQFPEMAPRVRLRGRLSTTRRAFVEPAYYLYYSYEPKTETLLVRCFWHEKRKGPRL